ncbi:hypothetical protein D9F73_12010 [Escherichia coli]|uniref:hypothetical protein n=1 Tax=Escherichia coli TaxID=562 RepID=UPI000FBBEEEB|nr:hypothetical protein [Escherichia coli]EEZ8295784.1 hypothetical protein [Escherichia coli]EFH5858966.1 hypothetical protein [Escherichia coli]EGH0645751.1 hypothetical protein [Escherichia coli]EHH6134346.1 hypothetical protein [Escherichia coli]EJA7673913.1 hypothetical protein [Escherichia coli]
MHDFEQMVEQIKGEVDKYGEDIAPVMLARVARFYAPYYFNKDDVYKRRLLSQFAELERRIGLTENFDWLSSLEKYKNGL